MEQLGPLKENNESWEKKYKKTPQKTKRWQTDALLR